MDCKEVCSKGLSIDDEHVLLHCYKHMKECYDDNCQFGMNMQFAREDVLVDFDKADEAGTFGDLSQDDKDVLRYYLHRCKQYDVRNTFKNTVYIMMKLHHKTTDVVKCIADYESVPVPKVYPSNIKLLPDIHEHHFYYSG